MRLLPPTPSWALHGGLILAASPFVLLSGCATGASISVAAAPAEEPGVSFFFEGGELQVAEGLPVDLRGLPSDLGPRPRSTLLAARSGRYGVVVDASDPARPPRMWVDTDGSGDFSGVVPTVGEWDEGRTAYASEEVTLHLPTPGGGRRDFPVSLSYRGPLDGPWILEVAATAWLRGKVALGGREFPFVLRDADGDGDYRDLSALDIGFDRDGDGVVDGDRDFGECYRGDERFNLGTGTFRLARVAEDGTELTFERVWPGVAVRPFLGVGDPAPPIPGTDLDGKPISLGAYRGRKVLLLFWAEW